MNDLIHALIEFIFKLSMAFILILLLAFACSIDVSKQTQTDWNDDGISNQISRDIQLANAQWIKEFGDIPLDLSSDDEAYLKQQTKRLQAQYDNEVINAKNTTARY